MGLFFLSTSPTLAISNLYSGILQSASHLLDSAQQDLTRCRFIRGHSEFCFCPHADCTALLPSCLEAMRCDAMEVLFGRAHTCSRLPSFSFAYSSSSSFVLFRPVVTFKVCPQSSHSPFLSLSSFLSLFFSRPVKYYVPPMINL